MEGIIIDAGSALDSLETQASGNVHVSALRGGTFTIPVRYFVADVPDDEKTLVPSLSFLLKEYIPGRDQPKCILFDLGLRRDTTTYAPAIREHLQNRLPINVLPDVRQSLQNGGLDTESISQVILSHVHWDHIGTPSDFPTAHFLVGAGSLELLQDSTSSHMSHSSFQHNLFDGLNVSELPNPSVEEASGWISMAGLKLFDLNGNGTIYAVDSPGHLPGHIALLVRRKPRKWLLLIGDACHDSRLLTGEKTIATWVDNEARLCCIHTDRARASQTLRVFREWKEAAEASGHDLKIVFAHDASWANAHPEAFFPGCI